MIQATDDNPLQAPTTVTCIVMAKAPEPGKVKTRLTLPNPAVSLDKHTSDARPLDQAAAAMVHDAMLACVLQRAASVLPGPYVLAVDTPGDWTGAYQAAGWRVLEQGAGDLGRRMDRVWHNVGNGPAIFLGVDSPDLPADCLASIPRLLSWADVAIGESYDGGYWTIAAKRLMPQLLIGIDWKGPKVYHQTLARARRSASRVAQLPKWHDVDTPDDLLALRLRLRHVHEPALVALARRLDEILEPLP